MVTKQWKMMSKMVQFWRKFTQLICIHTWISIRKFKTVRTYEIPYHIIVAQPNWLRWLAARLKLSKPKKIILKLQTILHLVFLFISFHFLNNQMEIFFPENRNMSIYFLFFRWLGYGNKMIQVWLKCPGHPFIHDH